MTDSLEKPQVTKIIKGHSITLEKRVRYVASLAAITQDRRIYPVSIRKYDDSELEVVIADLEYDQAKELVNAFNNGAKSRDGRIW